MEVLKISSKSNPNSVAGAIAGLVKESNEARMQAIGAGALLSSLIDGKQMKTILEYADIFYQKRFILEKEYRIKHTINSLPI